MTPWAGLIATFLLQYLKMKYHTILFFIPNVNERYIYAPTSI